MASESGWGKSANATNQHNPLSIMGSGPLKHYGTIEEGMKAGAKNLYDLYISEGLDTPAKIQPKYAPNGASNDPTDLNSNWKNLLKVFKSSYLMALNPAVKMTQMVLLLLTVHLHHQQFQVEVHLKHCQNLKEVYQLLKTKVTQCNQQVIIFIRI